jgi:iron(III) transport system permease protein
MVFSSLGAAIKNTYLYGLSAMAFIVLLGMLIAYITTRRRNWLTSVIDSVTMLPYIIPGSVLGITLLLAFNKPPVLLSGTGLIIVIVYIIRRMPYTIRSSAAILYQISPSIEEASISLGVSPVKTFFKVTMIMMLPGVFSGAILSWITVINELSASVILYTTGTRTMSVAIYAEVIRASYGTAAALSSILCVTTIISLLIFFKVSGTKEVSL